MTSMASIHILGCGTSGGVPQLAGGWGQCDPNEPKNRRSRCSILIEYQGQSILVDTTPECRIQLENHDITKIQGLIYTHTHADHCHGLDETRWICQAKKAALNTYGFQEHIADLQSRFAYAWLPMKDGFKAFYKPLLLPNIVQEMQGFTCAGMQILPLRLSHGFSEVMGMRIGNFAYCTDVVTLTEQNFLALEGIDYWVVDCLRYKPHNTHAHLERTLEWIARLNPKKTYLTHMNNDMDYQSLMELLPDNVEPSFDGLNFSFCPTENSIP